MMKRLLAVAMLLSFILPLAVDEVSAARMGGGKSFGGKSSYSKPTAPAKDTVGMQGQAQKAAPNPAGGGFMSRFGGLGGMLGGLLIGGMLGSLLFGGGLGFPGLLDILLIGGGLLLLFRFLRSRRTSSQSVGHGSPAYSYAGASPGQERPPHGPGSGWQNMGAAPAGGHHDVTSGTVPAGFDKKEFIRGAKAAYTRLQASWDSRDLADIRRFTSDAVFEEIRRQAAEDPSPGRTEILLVNAGLLEVRLDGRNTVASVRFDVLLREDPLAQSPTQIQEIWHFQRDERTPGAEWVLDGIQQVTM